jgi:hypothetical protein
VSRKGSGKGHKIDSKLIEVDMIVDIVSSNCVINLSTDKQIVTVHGFKVEANFKYVWIELFNPEP